MASPQPVPEQEKPLHVRVAEALGCKPVQVGSVPEGMSWFCDCERDGKHHIHGDGPGFLPRYDTDWGMTGPIIERLGINVNTAQRVASVYVVINDRRIETQGDTPLAAACNAILALKEAGAL